MHHYFMALSLLFLSLLVQPVYSEILKVGISTNYAPVAFKENGKIVGIEADLAKQVGAATGMQIQMLEIPWDKLENALNQGKVDVLMSGISITAERKKRLDFTRPYMTIGQMVLIKADNIMDLSSKMAMYTAGKRFGVEKNTTGEQFANEEFSTSRVFTFSSVQQGIQALKTDKIDYFIHDAPTIWQYTVLPKTQDRALFGLYEYMTNEPLAWAVKKGNEKLLLKLNTALKQMQSQGLVNRSINRWIPIKIEVGN